MTGFCPYKKGSLKESECHHDGYCSDCPYNTKDDTISRQAAIDVVMEFMPSLTTPDGSGTFDREIFEAQEMFVDIGQALSKLPPAQPDGIPLEWINKHLEWLDNCDNDFAQLAKVSIRAMVELWKKDRI